MRKQRGVSLVEIMVAITIGMLLMLGLGTVFVSVAQTSKLSQTMSAVQDSERTAIAFLNNSIRSSGYLTTPLTTTSAAQFVADSTFTTPGQTILGTNTGTDNLYVRFVAASGVTASQGCSSNLTSNALYTDKFYVATSGSNTYLTCDETVSGTTTTINLVPNLSSMSIVYGIDPNCTGSVTEYLPASSVPATVWGSTCSPPAGAQLKTINFTLAFKNPLAGQPSQPTTVKINQTIPYMIGL